jgi:plasmid stabilization system protein ParE
MTYHVVIQPRAERDIRTSALWILGQSGSGATALRWARNLRARVATLKTSPQRCPVDPDSEAYGEEVRVLLYGKRRGVYRVLFAIRGDTVHILTVRHASQRSLAEEMAEDDPNGGGEQAD